MIVLTSLVSFSFFTVKDAAQRHAPHALNYALTIDFAYYRRNPVRQPARPSTGSSAFLSATAAYFSRNILNDFA